MKRNELREGQDPKVIGNRLFDVVRKVVGLGCQWLRQCRHADIGAS